MWLCSSLGSSQPWGPGARHVPPVPKPPLRVRGLNTSSTALIILESHSSQNSQRTSPRAPRAGRDEETGNKYQSDFIGGRGTVAPSPGPGLLVLQTPFSSFPSSSSSSRHSRHTWYLEPGAVRWHRRGILIPGGSLSLGAARGIGGCCGLTRGVGGHSSCRGVSRGTRSGRRGLPGIPNPWRGAEGECGGKQELGQAVAGGVRGARE